MSALLYMNTLEAVRSAFEASHTIHNAWRVARADCIDDFDRHRVLRVVHCADEPSAVLELSVPEWPQFYCCPRDTLIP